MKKNRVDGVEYEGEEGFIKAYQEQKKRGDDAEAAFEKVEGTRRDRERITMKISPEKIIETICRELFGSPSLQVYLGMAVEIVDRGFFGSAYNQAVAFKACHLFVMFEGRGGIDGIKELGDGAPIASMSEGGLSVTFAQGSGGGSLDDSLGTTKFGKMYMALVKSRPRMGVNRAGGI